MDKVIVIAARVLVLDWLHKSCQAIVKVIFIFVSNPSTSLPCLLIKYCNKYENIITTSLRKLLALFKYWKDRTRISMEKYAMYFIWQRTLAARAVFTACVSSQLLYLYIICVYLKYINFTIKIQISQNSCPSSGSIWAFAIRTKAWRFC